MRFRKAIAAVASVAPLSLMMSCGIGGGGSGDVTLTMSTFLTEDHPVSVAMSAWMDDVTERSDGSIKFEEFYNGSLCSAPESLSCAEDRTADIVLAVPAYNPEMTLANIGSVAFVTRDLQANGDALNKLYADNEDYRAEYEDRGLKMLYTMANSMPVLASVDSLSGLGDINKLSVRASGAMSTGIAGLGANPVAVDPAEVYESLERGVVQGAAFPLESVVDYRLTEVAKNVYDLGEFMGSYAMNTFTMNLEAFEGLDTDQQAILEEASADLADSFVADYLVPSLQETCATLKKDGVEVKHLGPVADGEAWAEKSGAEQRSAWEKAAKETTDDPAAMFDAYLANVEAATSGTPKTTAEICEGV